MIRTLQKAVAGAGRRAPISRQTLAVASCSSSDFFVSNNHSSHSQKNSFELRHTRTFSTRLRPNVEPKRDNDEIQKVELDRVISEGNKGNTLEDLRKADRLLVVGSGVAGCAAALVAAETYQIPVTLLFAGSVPEDCNSSWAQGGIIYRNFDPESGDSAESLAQDIHKAGAGLCENDAVQKVSVEGPERVRQLLLDESLKQVFAHVPFDKREDGSLSLCLGTFFSELFSRFVLLGSSVSCRGC